MSEVRPGMAALLAEAVYGLTKKESVEKAIRDLNISFGEIAAFHESTMMKAKTGGPWFIKCRTAFGFTLIGKGRYEGHAFLLFRGTQYLADWLTNLNVGLSRSASGQPIHDGFNMSFRTMQPKLQEFMGEILKSNIKHIHCIGHSLGGALAAICADWIRTSYKIKPYLYTFGSPRVGLVGFADLCTSRIGANRIFRVYHKTDIVPCIPIWPYVHTPNKGTDYFLPSPGMFPAVEYHGMDHYINSVTGKNWAALSSLRVDKKTENGILRWLKAMTPVGLTIDVMAWLNSALQYVLRKCFKGLEWHISNASNSTFTLMDRLAYILSRPVVVAKNVSSLVLLLIRKIMQVLGLNKQIEQVDLTRDFIRYILISLQTRANQYAQHALGKLMVSGRQI